MKRKPAVAKTFPQRRSTLAISIALIAASLLAACYFLARLRTREGAERLRSDVPRGEFIALRDGNVFIRGETNPSSASFAITRLPVDGSESKLVSLSDVGWYPARFFPADDGLYIVGVYDDPVSVRNNNQKARAASDQQGRPTNSTWLGYFLLSPPQPGERRVSYPLNPIRSIRVWRLAWNRDTLQSIPLSPQLRAAPASIGAVNASGVCLTQQTSNQWVQVYGAKGVRFEYSPDTTLMYVPFDGSAPQVLVRNLAAYLVNPTLKTTSTACWDRPRMYPDTRQDRVCRMIDKSAPVPDVTRITASVSTPRGTWWLDSTSTGRPQLRQRLTGQAKAQTIEPPVRRSEADVLHYEWLRPIGDHLYVLGTVLTKGKITISPEDPRYLVRLTPKLAGHPGFWGQPVVLPSKATSFITDDNFLYYVREEEDKNPLIAVQDVLSATAPTPVIRRILYRQPLP